MKVSRSPKRALAIKHGYKSGLEDDMAACLLSHGIDPNYEAEVIPYEVPSTWHKYTPDFPLAKFVLETKGRFLAADRKKHLLVREQYPLLDLRIVFSNAKARLSKKSRTTYAMWCDQHGIQWAHKTLPEAWLKELKRGVR